MKTFLVGLIALCALSFAPLNHAADPRRTEPARGNLTVGENGTKLNLVKTGRVTLVAGVGTVTTTDATAAANIFPFKQVGAGTEGVTYSLSRSNGVSFTITAKAADGTTTATGDTSQIGYILVRSLTDI